MNRMEIWLKDGDQVTTPEGTLKLYLVDEAVSEDYWFAVVFPDGRPMYILGELRHWGLDGKTIPVASLNIRVLEEYLAMEIEEIL